MARTANSLLSARRLSLLCRLKNLIAGFDFDGSQHAHFDCQDFQCLQVRKRQATRQMINVNFIPRPNRYNKLNDAYFWFYVLFLSFRTLSVLFFSAAMNEASKEPLNFIRNVPSKFWTLDVSWSKVLLENFLFNFLIKPFSSNAFLTRSKSRKPRWPFLERSFFTSPRL